MPGVVALVRRAVRPYPGRVAGLGALMLGAVAIQVGVPVLLRDVIDRAVAGDAPGAATRALAVIAAGLVAQSLALGEAWVAADLAQRTTNDLRASLARHVVGLDAEFHAANPPGALIERVDGDTTLLAGLFSRLTIEVVHALLVLVGALGVVAMVSPIAAVGLAVAVGGIAGALRLVNDAGAGARIDRAATRAVLFGTIEERLAGIEDTRATGTAAYASWHVNVATRRWLSASFRALTWNAAGSAAVAIGAGLMGAVAIIAGGNAYAAGTATLGDLVALLAYVDVLRRPVEQLARQAQDFGNALAGAARVNELLATPGPRPIHMESSSTRLPAGALGFRLSGVSHAYPGALRSAVAGATLEVPAGAFVGVVGHTGSGKTTLGRLLVRAVEPAAGTIHVGGVDLQGIGEADLRERVAVVSQDVALFHATVRDNVTLFDRSIPDDTVRRALDRVGLGEWLAGSSAGLDTKVSPAGGRADDGGVDRPDPGEPGGLSAGEAQLLALARAFVRDAGLVVLDEPAARIDPVTETRLVEALRELARDRTIVVIAHQGTTLAAATHLLHLDGGRVVTFGPVAGASTPAWPPPSLSAYAVPPVGPDPSSSEDTAWKLHGREGGEDPHPQSLPYGPPKPARHPTSRSGLEARGPDPTQAPTRGADVGAREVAQTLWTLLREYPAWWFASVSFAGVIGYLTMLVPGAIHRAFLDAVATGGASAFWFGAVIAAFGIVRAATVGTIGTIEPWTQLRGAGTIAANALGGVLASRAWPVLPGSPGEALSRLRDDARVIGRFTTYLGDPFGQVFMGVGAWGVLASRDATVALAAVIPIIATMLAVRAAAGAVAQSRRQAAEGVGAVTDLLGDMFTAAATLRLAGATDRVVSEVEARGERRRRTAVREAMVTQAIQSAWRNVGTATVGIVLLASVPALVAGTLTPGDAALAASYALSLTFLGEIYGELVLLYRGTTVALGRIGALVPAMPLHALGAPRPLRLLGQDPAPPMPVTRAGEPLGRLDVADLTYEYPGAGTSASGIRGATFAVAGGTFPAITGAAGAGKTTLVRALLGLVPATGTITWDGRPIDSPGEWMVPPNAAATPQVPRLFSDSVRANVLGWPDLPGPDGSDAPGGDEPRLMAATHLAALDRDLADGLLDLGTRVGPRGVRLSGGQRQRVAAARMFATGASLLVLDDLSSALDDATEAVVWDRVFARGDLTVIAVTNRPAVIARATQVIAVEAGRCRIVRNA